MSLALKSKEPAAAAKPAPAPKPFRFTRGKLANDPQLVRNHWVLTADAGTTFERMLADDTYQAIRPDLRVGDRLEIREATLKWYAELIVVAMTQVGVAVRALQHHSWDDIPDGNSFEEKSDYEIRFEGLGIGHVVRRRNDGQKMHSQVFTTREQAQDFLRLDLIPRAARNRFG
jgi:hypothetical protein